MIYTLCVSACLKYLLVTAVLYQRDKPDKFVFFCFTTSVGFSPVKQLPSNVSSVAICIYLFVHALIFSFCLLPFFFSCAYAKDKVLIIFKTLFDRQFVTLI